MRSSRQPKMEEGWGRSAQPHGSPGVTVTFDLEDNRTSPDQPERFVAMSERFLEHLHCQAVTATVFIVGQVARDHPALVRRVGASGHEVALHGMRHVALGEVGPRRLPRELREGRALLEDLTGSEVRGFRAPIFSLTPATAWAVEQIHDAGFSYSSSVLPAANPLHGWPGAPRRPFRWAQGPIELPCPVGGFGRLSVPFLGGVYLRYLPRSLSRAFLRGLDGSAVRWSYLHPYDIDTDEPFHRMPGAGWVTSRILHARRTATLRKLDALIAASGGAGPPLGRIAERLADAELQRVG